MLHSLITPDALHADPRIDAFSASHHAAGELQEILVSAKTEYANYLLLRLFTFDGLSANLNEWRDLIAETNLPDKQNTIVLYEHMRAQTGTIDTTAEKFQRQLRGLIEATGRDPSALAILQERCGKAIEYFAERIAAQLAAPLREHVDALAYKKVKRYLDHVQVVEKGCWSKIEQLYAARFLDEQLYTGAVRHTRYKLGAATDACVSGSTEKGGTFQQTLDLHRQGKQVRHLLEMLGTLRLYVLSGSVSTRRNPATNTIASRKRLASPIGYRGRRRRAETGCMAGSSRSTKMLGLSIGRKFDDYRNQLN